MQLVCRLNLPRDHAIFLCFWRAGWLRDGTQRVWNEIVEWVKRKKKKRTPHTKRNRNPVPSVKLYVWHHQIFCTCLQLFRPTRPAVEALCSRSLCRVSGLENYHMLSELAQPGLVIVVSKESIHSIILHIGQTSWNWGLGSTNLKGQTLMGLYC